MPEAEVVTAGGQTGWVVVVSVAVTLLGLLVGFCYYTRAGMIARATTKEAIRQPLFALLIVLGIVVLILNTIIPAFTFGSDFKLLMDCGLATLLISGLLLGVWTSSTSVAAEIEGKTAMTLLSKPVDRRQFIIGKYVGILNSILLMLVPLTIMLLLLIYFKVGYDARESSAPPPEHAERMSWVLKTLPGIGLIVMESAVLTAVSVAISTRLPMIVNLVTCMTIFVVGHLTAILVQSSVEGLEFVKFMGQAIATILPQLENFNISAAIATGSIVPPSYLGWALAYCVAYSAMAILLAFILFEDRDLA